MKSAVSIVCAALFVLITLSFANAQTCPDPGGGINDHGLDFTTANSATLFPQSLPSGQSGSTRSTVGRMRNSSTVTTIFPSNVITINPTLTNGHTGSVVLFFRNLWFGDAPNAELKIFRGTNTSGTLVATINAADSTTYTQTSVTYTGPVTLQFQSPVAGTSGKFDIHVRYWTGDQVFQSGFGRLAAVWTDFVQPNSSTFIDDQRTSIATSPYTLNTNPIAIARFDANRQLISSELAFCMDSHLTNVGHGWGDYPGGTSFTYGTDPDIDNSGTVDANDPLRTAWLGWLMANRTTVPVGNLQGTNWEVWNVLSGSNGAWSTAIPSLPTPVEPTFSISAPEGTVAPGSNQTFTVNFDMAGSYAKRLKLVVPGGVTIQSVTGTGVTYSGGYINFGTLPGTATIQATSATAQGAQLQVLYDEAGFYNVNNFLIFVPCRGATFQRFVGFKQGEVTKPHREASAAWISPLNCTDAYYQTNEGTSLYRVNITTGTRSLVTSVAGADFNAMGYSPIDNFLWGYNRATNQVFKLGADGAESYTIPNMPAAASATSRTVGTVDLNGYLYLYEPNATQYIVVDVNPNRSTYLQIVDPTNAYVIKTAAPYGTTTTARNISDWAYNPTTGLIHAVINGAGSNAFFVSQLNPVTGVSTLSASAVSGAGITISGSSEVFDSQFFDASGNLIVYANSAAFFYAINPTSNTATQLSTTKFPITSGNDGAACLSVSSPTSFACSTLYYQVETDKLYSLNQAGTRTLVATLSGNLNAIGFNTLDNMLWGFDNASGEIFKLGANGVIQRFAVSGLPAATQPDGYSVGTVNTNGYLFLYEKNGLSYITVDIDASRVESYLKIVDPTAGYAVKTAAPWGTTLSGGARGISDWAYNPVDNLIYALTDGNASTPYQILQVNPLTGATTLVAGQVTGTGIQTSSQNFGSSFFDASGSFTVFGNTTGHLYRINLNTNVATQMSSVATPSSGNDGAFCTSASSPLPVALVSFQAIAEIGTTELVWATASEVNNKGFEVQRSADAKNWAKLGFVSRQTTDGNSSSQLHYDFVDTAPLKGINYYRLKMVDMDESFAYSNMRSVQFGDSESALVVYPNPVIKGKITIHLQGNASQQAEIQNLSGVVVLRHDLGKSKEVNVSSLVSGVYLLRVRSTNGEVKTSTFVVQ